jgi:hypothetical protein
MPWLPLAGFPGPDLITGLSQGKKRIKNDSVLQHICRSGKPAIKSINLAKNQAGKNCRLFKSIFRLCAIADILFFTQ